MIGELGHANIAQVGASPFERRWMRIAHRRDLGTIERNDVADVLASHHPGADHTQADDSRHRDDQFGRAPTNSWAPMCSQPESVRNRADDDGKNSNGTLANLRALA